MCLSEDTVKAVGLCYLVFMPGEVKVLRREMEKTDGLTYFGEEHKLNKPSAQYPSRTLLSNDMDPDPNRG